MLNIILTLALIVLFSFQSLFTRLYSSAYEGDGESTSVFTLCYGLFTALGALIINGFRFAPSGTTLLMGLLNAAVLVLYNNSMIRAGLLGSYAFMMTASLFGGIVLPLIAGVAFLSEKMSALQWVAVGIMLIAIVLMNSKGLSFKRENGKYYLWCALLFLSNGLYGIIMNLQATKLGGGERNEMLIVLFGASALLALLMESVKGRAKALFQGFKMGKKAAIFLLVCCASAFTAANLMLYLLSRMQSGLLYTMDNGGVLALSFVYSVALFHEKPGKSEIAGMALAAVSIVLINLW